MINKQGNFRNIGTTYDPIIVMMMPCINVILFYLFKQFVVT